MFETLPNYLQMVMYTSVQPSSAYTYMYYWGGIYQSSAHTNYGQDFRTLKAEYQNGYNIFGVVESARLNMYAKLIGNIFYWYSNYSYKEDGPERQFNKKNYIYYWIAF